MLAEPARKKLLNLGTIYTIPANHVLMRQGDAGGSVWLLIDAVVKVTGAVENGSVALLALRVSGDVVGEMAVIDGSKRSATVTSCGRAVVSQIKGPQFVEFLRENADASLTLTQLAIGRLRWSNQRRLDFAGYETAVCVSRVLLALTARDVLHET